MGKPKAWIAWSSGKDAAWALHVVRQTGDIEIIGLLTTITEPFRRVSMHGVREELLAAQTKVVALPVHRVSIPNPCPQDAYDAAMRRVLQDAKAEGITHVVFGDVFLADVRAYREARLAEAGLAAHFPLWMRDTAALAREMIEGGLRATVTCLDPKKMPRELAGCRFDEALLARLPDGVDPCGENGEFHTFAWDGPMFDKSIEVKVGRTVERDGFVFTDVLPAGQSRDGE